MQKDEIERYCRQMIVPGVGLEGQLKLKSSSVLVVGAGGLGCPVSMYLAAAGVGRIGLVDYDTVDLSNLQRQIGHAESSKDLRKVSSLAASLKSINHSVKVDEHYLLLSSENGLSIARDYDIIVDATDNIVTRYLLNDAAVLCNKPLVSGAALRLEGQLSVYNYGVECPCFRCLHPNPPPPETVSNCDEGGVLGPITGTIGSLQALEVIKIITMGKSSYAQKMLLFDGFSGSFRTVKLRKRRIDCEVCSSSATITTLQDYALFCGSEAHDKGLSLDILPCEFRKSVVDLRDAIASNVYKVIDVRPQSHYNICSLPNTINIPFSDLDQNISKIPKDFPVLCLCRRGNDSQKAALLLRSKGFEAYDVAGGLHEYANRIDLTIPRF